jgi:fibronectin-binding autotransporter adhesin
MDGTASITTTSGDDFQIALGDGGHGEITLDGHANITTGGSLKMGDTSGASGYSRLNLNGSSWVKVKELWIGQNSTGDHAVNVNGTSTLTSDGWFCVGRGGGAGVLNVNGGTVKKEGGGNFVVGSLGAIGIVYLNSGSILNNSALLLGGGTGGIGYFHLNGGLVQANSVSFDGGTPAASVLYYNGGTLQAIADSGDFVNTAVTQLVQSNGAVIDTNTHAITIAAALVEDTVTPSTGGGLKKIGAGTLTLTGALSYTGDTIVNDGTLTIAGTGELNTPLAKVEVATGATLNASSITCDTLTIGGGPFSFASSLAPVTPVPEPSTMALLLLAGLSLAGWAIRRFR